MNLYLIRHGAAEDPGAKPDSERALTDQGRKQLRAAARALARTGLELDAIVTSPLLRARQTAEIIAKELGLDASLIAENAELAPGGNPVKLLKDTRAENVALVGHEPYLSELASVLLTGTEDLGMAFKKGGVCALSAETLRYGRCARLEWLVQPKLLR
jgi:phosphohistidine phosphatase